MIAPFESLFETEGFDEQTRSQYALEAVQDMENGSPLLQLYDYWSSLSVGSHGIPTLDTCRPMSELPRPAAQRIAFVDTTAEDPMEFVVHDSPDSPLRELGAALPATPLGAVSAGRLHVTACAMEYLSSKHERAAMYHEIDQILCGTWRRYRRLIVPVADAAGSVARLYLALRPVRGTVRVAALSSEER